MLLIRQQQQQLAILLMMALLLMLSSRTTARQQQFPSNILVEAHCNSALRIRIAPADSAVVKNSIGALSEACGGEVPSVPEGSLLVGPGGEVSNGNVKVVVTATSLVVSRVSDGLKLLSG
eukprot:COSAG01_NODE_43665_length_427_cov_1.271341_1_plen_119_part_01